MRTRLELVIRQYGLKPAHVARAAGYARQHLHRLRATPAADQRTIARLTLNLATCDLRAGAASAARVQLMRASAIFTALGAASEVARAGWLDAKIAVAESVPVVARLKFRQAMRDFERLKMPLDAGFAELDLLELLLTDASRVGEAERLARRLVTTFVRAGTRASAASALAYLREAVAKRAAHLDIETLLRDPDVWEVVPLPGSEPVTAPFLLPDRVRDDEVIVAGLIEAAARELERKPSDAVPILDAAEEVAARLSSQDAIAEYRTEIWKLRSTALWHSGKYQEALGAIDIAWDLAEQHPGGAFMHGQLAYARGCAFWKVGRHDEAVAAAREAADRLSEYGDIRRVAHARLLEAVVRTEQGDVAGALHVYTDLRPLFDKLGDAPAAARVIGNIAVSHLRLHAIVEVVTAYLRADDPTRRFMPS